MSPSTRYAQKHANASQRRRLLAPARLERDKRQAPRAAEALPHAWEALRRPAPVVAEREGRWRSQQKRLGQMGGVRVPPLVGGRTTAERWRVRGGAKPEPSRVLGALPKRSWLKRLRRLGVEVLGPLWRPGATHRPATQSHWQGTGVSADAVCTKAGQQLARGGTGWSGQHTGVLAGRDGLVLVGVIGEGTWVVPVDVAMRRPAPVGAGAPCRDQRRWARTRRDERLAALRHRGLALPPPIITGARWVGDAQLRTEVPQHDQGPFLGEGKTTDSVR